MSDLRVVDEAGNQIVECDDFAYVWPKYYPPLVVGERVLVERAPGEKDMPDFDGTGYDPGDVELILKRINADMDEFPDFDGSNDVDDKDDAGKEVACPKCGHVWTP